MSDRKKKRCGEAPSYWWDFVHTGPGQMNVVVETDIKEGPIATFYGDNAVEQAEQMIADLEAGRRSP